MTLNIETSIFKRNGFEVVEHQVQSDAEGGQEFLGLSNMIEAGDAFALFEITEGQGRASPDGFEADQRLSSGTTQGFFYDGDRQFNTVGLMVEMKPHSSARVLLTRVKRGILHTVGNVSCKLCKSAVMNLIRAALAMAGIPLPVVGDDLSAASKAFEAALDALQQGQMNVALQSIVTLLPPTVWDAIKQALHVANWIWDGIDQVMERVCSILGLCPKHVSKP